MHTATKTLIGTLGFLTIMLTGAANAKEISFRNGTCANLSLKGTADNACFGTQACQLELSAYETKYVRLRQGYSPRWAKISVMGVCEEQAYTVAGTCTVDLEDVLRSKGIDLEDVPEIGALSPRPIFEDVPGFPGQGGNFAAVTISVGVCEGGDDPGDGDTCAPRCSVR